MMNMSEVHIEVVDLNELERKTIKKFDVVAFQMSDSEFRKLVKENIHLSKFYESLLEESKIIIFIEEKENIAEILKKYLKIQKIKAKNILFVQKN